MLESHSHHGRESQEEANLECDEMLTTREEGPSKSPKEKVKDEIKELIIVEANESQKEKQWLNASDGSISKSRKCSSAFLIVHEQSLMMAVKCFEPRNICVIR
ncbi:hypothetical protein KIN20_031775 [Parelaphostrongylus tenuis]|uniref:Uncharacterized protein n=1 Tax=Parelaphostrongylus tenuis TaxID=148309 RepID=A0AAD5R5Y3_PARTN|nr:hypothetical protein KIN20_031775 [Parelaphostrongylus tenuis]